MATVTVTFTDGSTVTDTYTDLTRMGQVVAFCAAGMTVRRIEVIP